MTLKDVVKNFVVPYFDTNEEFFNIAWDFINANYDKIRSNVLSQHGKITQSAIPLGFVGETEVPVLKAILIFNTGFKQANLTGDIGQNILASVQEACSQYMTERKLTREILQMVKSGKDEIVNLLKGRPKIEEEKEKTEPLEGGKVDYRVWTNQTKPEGDIINKEEFDKYVKNKSTYQIFIIDGGEYEMGSVGKVYLGNRLILKQEDSGEKKSKKKKEKDYLTPYEYKLLIHTLKNKYRAGTIIELVEKCWGKKSLVEGPKGLRESLKNDKDTFMRETSTYRKTIANLSTLLNNEIGLRLRSYKTGCYSLTGKPAFCLLVSI